MLSFRKKVLVSDLILLLLFIAFLFPFVGKTVGSIMRKSLEDRALQLISQLEKTKDLSEMLEILKENKKFVFHQIALIDPEKKFVYTRLCDQMISQHFGADYELEHPELLGALQKGRGYSTEYAEDDQEIFSYIAISFQAEGHTYVLRVGFPYQEMKTLRIDFEVGFLLLGIFILILYTLTTLAIIHRLTRPIQQIVDTIAPYQEGREEFLPKIVLQEAMQQGEWGKLAQTLNSMSEKIQKQIQHLTHQKKETENILESLSEGVIALDTSAKVTFANQISCRMLRTEHEKIVGKTFLELSFDSTILEELAKKCHEGVLQALQTSEMLVQSWAFGNEEKMYLDLIAAPLPRHSGAILVLQDKTSDYKVIEMGKDFVANASHELRTPITIIRGFAEALEDLPNLSQEMLQEIAQKIIRTTGRLERLVKSLLTLSDLENVSEKNFRPHDLLALLEHTKQMLVEVYPEVSLFIKTQNFNKISVILDADLFELAIMNLLENAVKYSSSPIRIEIEVEILSQESVQITVQDYGIGIPEKDLPYIFDRFYTVDKARSRKSGGAGLGLSIAKRIIEKHKGMIRVSSEVGKGSSFIVTLPLKGG